MMKRTLVLLVILAILLPVPVYAYTPPEQGSENATDIIIWHGDNITIESANLTGTITIDSLEDALVAAAEAHAAAVAEDFLTLIIMALLIALVFWQKTIILYAIGALVTIVYGLSLAQPGAEQSMWMAGVAIAFIGTYFFYRIIMIAFDWVRSK